VVLFLLDYAVMTILGGTGIALAVTGPQKVLLRHTVSRAVAGAPRTLPSRGAPAGSRHSGPGHGLTATRARGFMRSGGPHLGRSPGSYAPRANHQK
jgi:hypothetical protein